MICLSILENSQNVQNDTSLLKSIRFRQTHHCLHILASKLWSTNTDTYQFSWFYSTAHFLYYIVSTLRSTIVRAIWSLFKQIPEPTTSNTSIYLHKPNAISIPKFSETPKSLYRPVDNFYVNHQPIFREHYQLKEP
jgi:hypothetical protein